MSDYGVPPNPTYVSPRGIGSRGRKSPSPTPIWTT